MYVYLDRHDGRLRSAIGGELVSLQPYRPHTWYGLEIMVKTRGGHGSFDISIDGRPVLADAQSAEAAPAVERLSFRTGAFRSAPTRNVDRYDKRFPEALPGCDEPAPLAIYCVDSVRARPQ